MAIDHEDKLVILITPKENNPRHWKTGNLRPILELVLDRT